MAKRKTRIQTIGDYRKNQAKARAKAAKKAKRAVSGTVKSGVSAVTKPVKRAVKAVSSDWQKSKRQGAKINQILKRAKKAKKK